jgi:hypothetical protein
MRAKVFACVAIALLLAVSAVAAQARKAVKQNEGRNVNTREVLWRPPQDIAKRNLFYGAGGSAGQPQGKFRFIKEDKDGTSPKFVVEDGRGVRWKVKLGDEVRSETAATRLLWAVGYFTDVLYYAPKLQVAGLPRLSRGQEYVSANGTVYGARLEREDKQVKKVGNWSWFENPFLDTKEFDGLRVMMALLNNWDLKESNNGIYQVRGRELRYAVTDLGATFGRTGGNWTRSKDDLADYLESRFIEEIEPTTVDFALETRPPVLYAVAFTYYHKRTRMENIAEDIPRTHARWIGGWLAQLSDGQLSDAFRAAGYRPAEVRAYTAQVRARIRQLNQL